MNAQPARTATAAEMIAMVESIGDPEMPFMTIKDLGILRAVEIDGADVRVTITPTYSGCPALAVIEARIRHACAARGYAVAVATTLSPPWTSDWVTDAGRAALAANAIAPPASTAVVLAPGALRVACPQCGSLDTERLGDFGSTACRAIRRCLSCAEPFDEFKAH